MIAASRLVLALTVLCMQMVHAQFTFNVNTTADLPDDGMTVSACHTSAGTCSLRAAVMKANQVNGSATINLPAGTYTLTIAPSGADGDDSGDLNFATSIGSFQQISVMGAGASRTIIDGNGIDRVIDIASGRLVSLTDLTIRNGYRVGANGGGIRNAGQTFINGCVIEDNSVEISQISGNVGNGAGIYSSGTLDILRSTIRGNEVQGPGNGGGINVFGIAIIRDSTINDNVARDGGGIFVTAFSQYVFAINSTISGNQAYNNGGGIYSVDSAAADMVGLYSTSVIGNDASSDSDQIGQGGGLYAGPSAGAHFVIVNTLIANNTINGRSAFNDCAGALEAYGFNLFSLAVPPGCTITGNGSAGWGQVSLTTIGPLQNNQGPTLTHALLQNSEAINSTTAQGCIDQNNTILTSDQRGAPRLQGFRCDVGAFEYGAVVDVIFKNGFN